MYLIRNSEKPIDLEKIKFLISKGKRNYNQINCQDNNGVTPLMDCFECNNNEIIRYDIIKLLLENKANIYIKDNKGKDIFKYLKVNNAHHKYYSLIFNYKNLENDYFCEYDINFIYRKIDY